MATRLSSLLKLEYANASQTEPSALSPSPSRHAVDTVPKINQGVDRHLH
jgi:hypothetical protein